MKLKSRILMRSAIIVAALLILVNTGCQRKIQSEMEKRSQISHLYQRYAQEFPLVEGIKPEELQDLMRRQQNQLVLIDVRSPKEREVSIIPGAITPEEFARNLAQYQAGNKKIVAYCTIGYRSGKYADQLRNKGIKILNLEGSLLAWSHIQGKLTNAQGTTNQVHVFGRQWQLTANGYQPVW